MENDLNLTPEDRDMERLLGRFDLKAPAIDEHAIWFEAGRRRGQQTTRVWRGAAAACVLMTIGTITWRNAPAPRITRQTIIDHPRPAVGEPTTVRSRSIAKDKFHLPIDLAHLTGWIEPRDAARAGRALTAGDASGRSV